MMKPAEASHSPRPTTSYLAQAFRNQSRNLQQNENLPPDQLRAKALTRSIQSLSTPSAKINKSVAIASWAMLKTGWFALEKQRTFRQYVEEEILPAFEDNDIRYVLDIVEFVFPLVWTAYRNNCPVRIPDERFPGGRVVTPRVIIEKRGAMSNLKVMLALIRNTEDIEEKLDLIQTALTGRRDTVRAAAQEKRLERSPITLSYREEVTATGYRWIFDLDHDQHALLRRLVRGIATPL